MSDFQYVTKETLEQMKQELQRMKGVDRPAASSNPLAVGGPDGAGRSCRREFPVAYWLTSLAEYGVDAGF